MDWLIYFGTTTGIAFVIYKLGQIKTSLDTIIELLELLQSTSPGEWSSVD